MKEHVLFCSLLLIALSLPGCTGPCADVAITSIPPGVAISINGRYLGKTPLNCAIGDIRGMGSRYVFRAERPGFVSEMRIYRERCLQGPRECLPPRVIFHLKPQE